MMKNLMMADCINAQVLKYYYILISHKFLINLIINNVNKDIKL